MKQTLLLLLFSFSVLAQNNGRISGKIVDQLTQKPISGVSITLDGATKGTTADEKGVFRLTGLALKTYNLSFTAVGYEKYTAFNVIINAGNENFLNIELLPSNQQLAEVVVTQNRRTAKAATLESPLSVQRLTSEEIKSNPGGNFDVSKVIQTLPGVGGGPQGGGFRNDIIIRGGGPNENVYYLDGIEIPVLNHFQTQGSSGGPQGILNVSFIEDVKLSSSAFDARYDNALSSVFQFKQRTGNPNKFQGNARLSATEFALTTEGPLSKSGKTTFLASVRRSYLQFLFQALDIPIRPNFWDGQFKITKQINSTTTLSLMGLGAIDEFSFGTLKESTPEKLYIYNSNPLINQWNYTLGLSLKKLLDNGYLNIALSRNSFDNTIMRYEDNIKQDPSKMNFNYLSRETENKLRVDVNKNTNGWKINYGLSAQFVEYSNSTYQVLNNNTPNPAVRLSSPITTISYFSPLNSLWKYGAFAQVSKTFFDAKLGLSAGLRTDMNSFTTTGLDPFETLSPRISASYVLSDKWTANASVGRYFKLAPYTILGYATTPTNYPSYLSFAAPDYAPMLVNQDVKYQQSDHYVTGLEYLHDESLRFTLEGFVKEYANVPISNRNGISLANLGGDFNILGNEDVTTTGKGRAYGFEFFAQKKLTDKFFGILSYTYYRSMFSGFDGKLIASSWDNRHLLSVTWGYKFPRNWELGLRFRYQGGAPYSPYDETTSRATYLTLGQGTFDYSRLNSQRLPSFHSSDVRIDKKYNLKKTTIDLFLDVTNWYIAVIQGVPTYTFKRLEDNSAFATTNGLPIAKNGSNAIPTQFLNDRAQVTPTIGFIVEF
jgi:hypothetical protein